MCLQNFDDGSTSTAPPALDPNDHLTYLRLALSQAHESPPKPTNFRVGALLVDADTGKVLASGYTLEAPGNTHAEQSALIKYGQVHGLPEERVGEVLPPNTVLYTTMEPCNMRSAGNMTCVDRILRTKDRDGKPAIRKVYSGVREPEKFVGENRGRAKLEESGIECVYITGLEQEILEVATAGHTKEL